MSNALMFVSGLVSEDQGETMSLGRVAFWTTFGFAVYMWVTGQDLLPSHANMLWITLVYNFGKKGMDIMKIRAKNGNSPVVSP
ncbi:MAG: hypothetical protein KKC03_13225 [Bacteroidetes bacterium]|nr:hypothetical protein [Bacteroidota bacterium]